MTTILRSKTTIYYYTTQTGDNPPKRFIESLTAKQKRKIARILAYIEEYGLITAIPHVKRLTGTPLWEIRILGQDNIRVFYATVLSNSILILHGFIKKSRQTPKKEIETSLNRLKDWASRNF